MKVERKELNVYVVTLDKEDVRQLGYIAVGSTLLLTETFAIILKAGMNKAERDGFCKET